MAVEDGAVARLLPADCLSIQEVGATGKGALGTAPGGWRRVWGWFCALLAGAGRGDVRVPLTGAGR